MPEFHLYTDGSVEAVGAAMLAGDLISPKVDQVAGWRTWSDLDSFTQGYIEALFFTNESCIDRADWDLPESQHAIAEGQADGCLPRDSGFADISPETLSTIVQDCADFQRINVDLLDMAYGRTTPARTVGDGTLPDSHRAAWDYDEAAAGRDFWFTRNRHGVGYWDREALKLNGVGDRLSDAAKACGEVDACLGDDGKVHLS